ncbi:unnamed protein product [Sympodiomycopsis kandeliae]
MSSPSGSSTSSYQSRQPYQQSGDASASSSGRTTPDSHHLGHQHHHHPHHHHHSSFHPHHHQSSHTSSGSKVLPHTIYGTSPNSRGGFPNQPPRRASTPSQGFLKPLFFSGFHHQHQQQQYQQHQQQPGNANSGSAPQPPPHSHSATSGPSQKSSEPPRRTSFGSALGSRLGALSALGVGSGWGSPAPQPHASSTTSSVATSPSLRPVDSMSSVEGGLPGAFNSQQAGDRPCAQSTKSDSNVSVASPKPRPVERRHICVPDGCGGFITVEQKG